MKTITTILFALTLQTAPAQHTDFHWLKGTWKLKDKKAFEVWTVDQSTGKLLGRSFRVSGSDTTVTETISLEYFEGAFHYVPDIAGNQPPVYFKITKADNQSFVAENPRHDFPKIIRYQYKKTSGKEHMEASIEGDGRVITYFFQKVE